MATEEQQLYIWMKEQFFNWCNDQLSNQQIRKMDRISGWKEHIIEVEGIKKFDCSSITPEEVRQCYRNVFQ